MAYIDLTQVKTMCVIYPSRDMDPVFSFSFFFFENNFTLVSFSSNISLFVSGASSSYSFSPALRQVDLVP